MGEFSAEWLALREPADHRARSVDLSRAVGARLIDRHPVRVVDLAAGTGSNLRYLARFLPPRQHWRLVDRDTALLAQFRMKAAPSVASVHLQPRDLSEPATLADLFEASALVTASALLDLVSAPWLDAVADLCRSAGAAALFALTYDGRISCAPVDPDDETVRGDVNRHQRTDKGFGPALGPDAAAYAQQCFASRGFVVKRERTDWTLGPADTHVQRGLIDGWTTAAIAIAPDRAPLVEAWRARRLEHVDGGRSTMVVGHEDLTAWIR